MKKIVLFIIFGLTLLTVKLIFASPGVTVGEINEKTLTLVDCYKLALKQSELIAVDLEKIKQAESHFTQALGTALPQISFSRSDTRNYSEISKSSNISFEQKFIFKQTLFSGFKEFAGMAGSRLEKQQRENETRWAEQLLFLDVSDAFYLLLELREDLKALETIKTSIEDRIKDLKTREELGKSRKSETVTNEVQLYNIEAAVMDDKRQEAVAKELLEFLIGQPVAEITESNIDMSLREETDYMKYANSRPDVKAAELQWKTDKKRSTVAKSGLFPTVTVESDYYNHRTSSPTDSDWSTILNIDVPIFSGTTTFGQITEANLVAKQSQLLSKRALRSAVSDIHNIYTNVVMLKSQTELLSKALNSAEINYTLQLKDYKSNLVNNLDVLTALQDWETAKRNYINISYETKRFYWQLLVVSNNLKLEIK
ncbi:MAG: TolC family protein [Candidatus Omnitrophica bacterium]|nr:TolC family protein [Candidatus Omnitrophota bacterium]